MTTIAATQVDDIWQNTIPGGYEFFKHGDRERAGIFYTCPCGCGRVGALDFRPQAKPPSWEWNGQDGSAITLDPSVHHIIAGETHWHGWLRNGEWSDA